MQPANNKSTGLTAACTSQPILQQLHLYLCKESLQGLDNFYAVITPNTGHNTHNLFFPDHLKYTSEIFQEICHLPFYLMLNQSDIQLFCPAFTQM
jgi:hypothetical protein